MAAAGVRGGPSRAELGGLALGVACGLAFLVELHRRVPQVDDAYISYRYAAHWIEGQGLVWNPGERVEGYTNLLWTLAIGLGLALGLEAPAVGHALGLASGAAALGATGWLARAGLPASRAAWAGLAPWLVLASTGFARWATSGLETPLFAALVTAALAAQRGGGLGLAAAFAVLATLTRPEGALLAALLFAFHLWRAPGEWRRVLSVGAVYGLALALLTGFRLAYYGEPLPNTFYAKVGGVSWGFGLLYLWSFVATGAGLLLLPALLGVVWRPRLGAAGLWVLACLAYAVWVGGDALGHDRLLLPALPALAALACCGAACAPSHGRALGALVVACLVASVWLQVVGVPGDSSAGARRWRELERVRRGDRHFEEVGRARAQHITRRESGRPLVATGAIGVFGYHSRLPVLDILGLVDPVVARTPPAPGRPGLALPGHQRSNAAYVFSREPEYLLIARKGTPGKGLLAAVAELWAHPDLERHYRWDSAIDGYRRRPSEPVPRP